jgi:hypothetical protein
VVESLPQQLKEQKQVTAVLHNSTNEGQTGGLRKYEVMWNFILTKNPVDRPLILFAHERVTNDLNVFPLSSHPWLVSSCNNFASKCQKRCGSGARWNLD